MRRRTLLIGITLGFLLGVGTTLAARQDSPVHMMKLPLKLPAVGNTDLVKNWRFGRVEQVEERAGQTDIMVTIRTQDGQTHRVVGPGPELAELARASDWVASPDRATPGRADFVERMIAFDVDEEQRIIAVISLEPINRSRTRLARGLRR